MKTKAHIRYRNKANEIVPGVTTINRIGNFGGKTEQLIRWGNKLGLQGIDSTKFRDEKGLIGDLAHEMIMAHLLGHEVDTADFTKNQMEPAEHCFGEWYKWWETEKTETILVEVPLVSELFQFGGKPDHFGQKGIHILDDWKTGFVSIDAYIQCCAYRELLIENGYPAADLIRIASLPRDKGESFRVYEITEFDLGWQAFKNLRQCYELEPALRKILK